MSDKYLVISGTNRLNSNTCRIAKHYVEMLRDKGIEAELLSLERIDLSHRSEGYQMLEREKLLPSTKFIFVAPEYNGSIPGVLKTMLDLSDYKKAWWGKKALLVGISTGRSGNVRGMEHLTSILNYLKVVVHPNKLPISIVDKLLNGKGLMIDNDTIGAIDIQLQEFIEF